MACNIQRLPGLRFRARSQTIRTIKRHIQQTKTYRTTPNENFPSRRMERKLQTTFLHRKRYFQFQPFSIQRRHYFKTIDTIEIDCIKLDTILQQDRIEVIDFLRIDAQGAAKQVLQGIDNKRLMRIKECYIKCNVSDIEIYSGQSYKEDVDRILLKYYFRVTEHETYSRGQEVWARYVSDSWKKSMNTKIYGLK
jgi:hypothetical protein